METLRFQDFLLYFCQATLFTPDESKNSTNEENTFSFRGQTGQEVDAALTDLTKLEPNWDEYGTQPPNSIAVENARKVIKVLSELNLSSPYLAPSSDEGVTISFLRKKKIAAIECFNTGEIIALTSDGTGSPKVWEVEGKK